MSSDEAAPEERGAQQPERVRPFDRTHGPRPLAAHLAAGAADLGQGAALALGAADPRFPWRASLKGEGAEMAARLGRFDPQRMARAIGEIGLMELDAALVGMRRAHESPAVRRPADPPVIWTSGSARLLDFQSVAADAPAVLIAPSLINGWRILDLTRARSLARGLRDRGCRVFLLDWGAPTGEERAFDTAAYAEQRLVPAIEAASAAIGGRQIGVMGHCMSGAISAGAALLSQNRVDRLCLLAAPWWFAPMRPPKERTPSRKELLQLVDGCGAVFGGVPADVLDTLFFLRDPLQAMRKFPAFGKRRARGPQDRLFIAVEDWLNQGLRLAAPAAKTLLIDWGLDDALVRRRWRVAGRRVDLRDFEGPIFVLTSTADTVAPHESAEAALRRARAPELARVSGGHVGMVVGRRADAEVWDRIAAFFRRAIDR